MPVVLQGNACPEPNYSLALLTQPAAWVSRRHKLAGAEDESQRREKATATIRALEALLFSFLDRCYDCLGFCQGLRSSPQVPPAEAGSPSAHTQYISGVLEGASQSVPSIWADLQGAELGVHYTRPPFPALKTTLQTRAGDRLCGNKRKERENGTGLQGKAMKDCC